MNDSDIYILNPGYDLRKDKNRIFICNSSSDPVFDSFIGFVHPVYAIILSLFDGERKLKEVKNLASKFLKKEKSVTANIISPLLENDKELYFNYEGYHLFIR